MFLTEMLLVNFKTCFKMEKKNHLLEAMEMWVSFGWVETPHTKQALSS